MALEISSEWGVRLKHHRILKHFKLVYLIFFLSNHMGKKWMQKTDVSNVQPHQTPSSARHPLGQSRRRRLRDIVNHVQPQRTHWGPLEILSGNVSNPNQSQYYSNEAKVTQGLGAQDKAGVSRMWAISRLGNSSMICWRLAFFYQGLFPFDTPKKAIRHPNTFVLWHVMTKNVHWNCSCKQLLQTGARIFSLAGINALKC